jgi:spoIIIJ-associated protein
MEWVETTAKTIDEAKNLALDQLGVAEEDAEFDIVDEPKPGLFGRMRGEARVRARVRPTQPRPKAERRDRRRKPKSDDKATSPDDAGTESDDSSDTTETAGGDRAPAERSNRSRSRRGTARPSTQTGDTAMTDDRETSDQPAPDPAVVGAAAVDFLTGLVSAFDTDGTVTLHNIDDEMEVRVEGDNLGLLVGPRGSTLLAIQDITRVASQRRLGDHQTRLRIDIAGYREKRREALGRFADKVAAEVAESGEERVLEAMPSADRKVIHDTLSGRSDVVTRSEGEDPRRFVVIAPA